MKVKDLFIGLKMSNELSKVFGDNEKSFIVYFDEMDRHEFTKWSEFRMYIAKEYIKEYLEQLVNTEGQTCLDGSVVFGFMCNGYKHTVEFYLK